MNELETIDNNIITQLTLIGDKTAERNKLTKGIDEELSSMRVTLQILNKVREQLVTDNCKNFYTIRCTRKNITTYSPPSYQTGLFSSKEEAKKTLL